MSDRHPDDMTRQRRDLPHNLEAEAAVIGCALLNSEHLSTLVDMLTPDDFLRPAHSFIWEAVRTSYGQHKRGDAVLVGEALQAAGTYDLAGGGTALLQAQSAPPAISAALRYAGIVRAHAQARGVLHYAGMLSVHARENPEGVAEIIESGITDLQAMRGDFLASSTRTRTPSLDDLTAAPWQRPRWVWPGMLAAGHRLALAGRGGARKTTFYRQGMIFGAAGIHPFLGDWRSLSPLDRPLTSLIFDLENDNDAWVMECRPMIEFVRSKSEEVTGHALGRLPVHIHALGGASYDPVNNRSDRADMWARLDEVRPDVLYFGPIYKLDQRSGGNDSGWHTGAGAIQRLLDEARAQFGCAVLLEMHVGKDGKADPRGAADWGYWPELGVTISGRRNDSSVYRVQHFRGKRFGQLYQWWPEEFYPHVRHAMPFRAGWADGFLPADGGPYAWDRPPGFDHPTDPTDAAGYGDHEPF